MSGRCFTVAEVEPKVAEIIRTATPGTWVTHQQLADGLLDQRYLVRLACGRCPDKEPKWMAGVMVAWFSRRYTDGRSPYVGSFERRLRPGGWSYRIMPATEPGDL